MVKSSIQETYKRIKEHERKAGKIKHSTWRDDVKAIESNISAQRMRDREIKEVEGEWPMRDSSLEKEVRVSDVLKKAFKCILILSTNLN